MTMNVLLVMLAAAGITFGAQHKATFLHGRFSFLDNMLKCTYCTGFHGGWIAYLLFSAPFIRIQEAVLSAFAGAIFSYALDEAIKFLEESEYGDDD